MRFVGGDSHGQAVPLVDRVRYTVVRGRQHYMRHADHFIIFGMAPVRALELIAQLEAPACPT